MTSNPTQPHGGLRSKFRTAAGAACLLLAASPGSAPAQGFGPDPFKPFNSQYESYVYPISPSPLDPVGNPSLNRSGVRGANRFDDYLRGVGATTNRYDQLYRSQISGQRRTFRPSTEADARFEDQQSAQTTLYFKYMRERDPVKRAALLKAYNKARKESAREVPAAARAANGRKAPKPGASGEAADRAAMDDETDDDAVDRMVSPPRRAAGRTTTQRSKPRAAVPPPPPLGIGENAEPRSNARPGATSSPRSRNRTPSDVLDRAGDADRGAKGPETPPPPPLTP